MLDSRMNWISRSAWSQAMTGDSFTPILSTERCGFSSSFCGTIRSTSDANGRTNGKKRSPRSTEKIVSVTAIGAMTPRSSGPLAVSVTTPQFGKSALPIGTNTGSTNGRNRADPMTFESVCASAVRFAAADPPMAASQAVIVVPMFAPNSTAMAIS